MGESRNRKGIGNKGSLEGSTPAGKGMRALRSKVNSNSPSGVLTLYKLLRANDEDEAEVELSDPDRHRFSLRRCGEGCRVAETEEMGVNAGVSRDSSTSHERRGWISHLCRDDESSSGFAD